jgi:hypothetical protein
MCSLCDMNEEILALVASSLAPPDVFALATTSKNLFWSEQPPQQPLGVRLVQAGMRRHLEELLEDVTWRNNCEQDCDPISLDDLFKDFDAAGLPQVRRGSRVFLHHVFGEGVEESKCFFLLLFFFDFGGRVF